MSSEPQNDARIRELIAEPIEVPTTRTDGALRATISNQNSNVNNIYGSVQTINNNNPITNYVLYGDSSRQTDSIQAKIAAALKDRHVPNAVYDAQLASGCMDGTRVQILWDIETWVTDPKAPQIFWLTGMAGTGKSAMAWTVCSRAREDFNVILGGSFFCSRSAGSFAQRNVNCVVPTLAQQLARQSDRFSEALAKGLARDPDVLYKQITAQVTQLLYDPLVQLKDSATPILFVIDALDECGGQSMGDETSDDSGTHHLVSDMLTAIVGFSRSSVRLPVKFLITSRPETHIRDTPVSDAAFSKVLRLHTVEKQQITADIHLYISNRLLSTPQLRSQFTGEDVEILTRLCDGLFIVAATALQYALGGGIDLAPTRFKTLLDTPREALSTRAAGPLDSMYSLILMGAAKACEVEIDAPLQQLLQVLAAILSARMTLSISSLADLMDRQTYDLRASLARLHAVVHVPNDDTEAGLRTVHASFGDYLIGRAPDHLRISESLGDTILARACLHVMTKRLHFNISQTRSSYQTNPRTKPESITLSVEYACLHWIYHVASTPEPSVFDDEIDRAFRLRFLFWLEVVSVLRRVSRGAAMLHFSASTVKLAELSQFLRDAHLFVVTSLEPIERSASHIYLSALPFTAKESLVYKTFIPLCTGLVAIDLHQINRRGGQLVMTLSGHEAEVNSVAYSPDDRFIASASKDGTVRLWDMRTGEEMMSPLHSGDGFVLCIAVAPDGRKVVSGTTTGVVCVWRLAGGHTALQRLSGHSAGILSVAISSDNARLASASEDYAVCLWDFQTSQLICTLTDHMREVNAVAFFPGTRLFASGSGDGKIRIWQGATSSVLREGHTPILSLCCSPGGATIAVDDGGAIELWNVSKKIKFAILRGGWSWNRSLQWSPNGRSLVSINGNSVCLWALTHPLDGGLPFDADCHLTVFEGHKGAVLNATFSSDGLYIASGSRDSTIRIWNVDGESQEILPHLVHRTPVVCSMAISKSGDIIVIGSQDHSVRVWNAQTGVPELPPLHGHLDSVTAVAISPNGCIIASGSEDRTIRLWDAKLGQAVGRAIRDHVGSVYAVTFSPDGLWLASGSSDNTVIVRDVGTRRPLATGGVSRYKGHVTAFVFTHDGLFAAAGDTSGYMYILHAHSGQLVGNPILANDHGVYALAFAPDGAHIVSAGADHKGRLWHLSTVRRVFVLNGHSGAVYSVSFSSDGQFITTGSSDNSVRLWSAMTGALLAILHGHICAVSSVQFTPDGNSILSGSYDTTIRVWNVDAARQLASGRPGASTAVLASGRLNMADGWLMTPSGELMIWVPAEYRQYLHISPCTAVIGASRKVGIASDVAWNCGETWTACWSNQDHTT